MTAGGNFEKIAPLPAYKMVFNAVEEQILSRKLNEGDLLPSETALAEQFGINRSTVREGIRLLEESGLVARLGGKRLRVRRPDPLDSSLHVQRALMLNDVTFREMSEAATALEPVIAGLAAERVSEEELLALEANLAEMEQSKSNLDEFISVDIAFHDMVARAARNRPLLIAREPVSSLLLPAGEALLPKLQSYDRVLQAHREIVEALRRRDAECAETWMRRHIADFERGYSRAGFDADSVLQGGTAPRSAARRR